MFESQDQVQQWIAQNPQFAQAIAQAMSAPPAPRYQPMGQGSQNWGGRNVVSPMASTGMNTSRPVTGLYGRIITNPQDIKPNEIPMDGTASLFPMADDSCIYAKAWGTDGMIQTIRYIPEKPAEMAENKGPSEFSQVMARLDKIEQMLGQRRQQNYNNRNNQQRNSPQAGQVSARDYIDNNNVTEATNNG